MKKALRILLAVLCLILGLGLLTRLLIKTGNLYLGLSPYSHYRLSETETKLIEDWISNFHKNVESGNFDEIRLQLSNNGQDNEIQDSQLSNAKFAFDKYGKVSFSKFFRSTVPEPASRFYGEKVKGLVYGLYYHSNAERGRLSENFELVINDSNVSLLRYHGDEMKEWEVGASADEYWLERNLPREIRIPFGERFIEIRY